MSEIKKPKYEFADYPEGVLIPAQPIKKNIAKTMEVTEMFNIFDVISYIAKLKKGIEDKEAEVTGMKDMLKLYEDELELIEKELGVQKAQEKWEKAEAERIQKESEEVKEPIESPYVEQDEEGDKESTA